MRGYCCGQLVSLEALVALTLGALFMRLKCGPLLVSASHNNWCTGTLRIIRAQWEGMGDAGTARYKPGTTSPMLDHKGHYSNLLRDPSTPFLNYYFLHNRCKIDALLPVLGKVLTVPFLHVLPIQQCLTHISHHPPECDIVLLFIPLQM